MSFEFTVAVVPNVTNIDTELQYIKSALLYADKVTLISPVAYLFTQLTTNQKGLSERALLRFVKCVLPLCAANDPDLAAEAEHVFGELSSIIYTPRYKNAPFLLKMQVRNMLSNLSGTINNQMIQAIGENQASELSTLLASKKVVLQPLEHSLADAEGCVAEYFELLSESVTTSYPLFDEASNDLMQAAIQEKVIRLNDRDKQKITHAGLSDNFIQRLPSFEQASVDEILDIRKELSAPLVRFRSKMLSYSEGIQSLPWDDDFQAECSLLYDKEVAPTVLELDELTKENSFIKNIGRKVLNDDKFFDSIGGLVVGVAAAGVIPTFTQAISQDTAIITTAAVWGAKKISAAYNEYLIQKKEIKKKDLFFYYQAGKRLNS